MGTQPNVRGSSVAAPSAQPHDESSATASSTDTILTTSELRSFQQCRLQWDWKYNHRLTPKNPSNKLVIGSTIHAGLEAHYGGLDALKAYEESYAKKAAEVVAFYPDLDITEEWADDYALGKDMLTRYVGWAKANDDFIVKGIEMEFRVPIPAFVRLTKNSYFAGKIDGLIERNGKLWIHEFKTWKSCSETELNGLQYDDQVTGYIWAMQQVLQQPIQGCVFTVLRKIIPSARSHPPYFARVPVYRNADELKRFERWLYQQLLDMRRGQVYRHFTRDCSWQCPFYGNLCLEERQEFYDQFSIREIRHSELNQVKGGEDV